MVTSATRAPAADAAYPLGRFVCFEVATKTDPGGLWQVLHRLRQLDEALTLAQGERGFERAVFVRTAQGSEVYWSSSRPDTFNSGALRARATDSSKAHPARTLTLPRGPVVDIRCWHHATELSRAEERFQNAFADVNLRERIVIADPAREEQFLMYGSLELPARESAVADAQGLAASIGSDPVLRHKEQSVEFHVTSPDIAATFTLARAPSLHVAILQSPNRLEVNTLELELTDRTDFLSKATDLLDAALRNTGTRYRIECDTCAVFVRRDLGSSQATLEIEVAQPHGFHESTIELRAQGGLQMTLLPLLRVVREAKDNETIQALWDALNSPK